MEKGWLTEKEVGMAEYPEEENFTIKELEILNAQADSMIVKLTTVRMSEIVKFRK